MRRAGLTLRALLSWAHHARMKTESRRRGGAAHAHAGAVLLQRAVLAWCRYLDDKMLKQRAGACRAAAAAAALDTLKRGRAWYAWVEVTRALVVMRLQGERADAHFEVGLYQPSGSKRHLPLLRPDGGQGESLVPPCTPEFPLS